jgi:hypothetical protein
MPVERCVRWEPVSGIESPCADITFACEPSDRLSAIMHFSHMTDHPPRDLRLIFSGAISLRWEDESFGLNPLPDLLPQLGSGAQSKWTFPLLRVEHSAWLAAHEARLPPLAAGRCHFALVALNDLLQILALPDVEAAWVDAPRNT